LRRGTERGERDRQDVERGEISAALTHLKKANGAMFSAVAP
jgi:hypothetical protein